MRTIQSECTWITEAVRLREADLADACAVAAAHIRDARVAGRIAGLVYEHLRHARPGVECTNACAPPVDAATLRARVHRRFAMSDRPFEMAVDGAVAGAIARAHAEVALFIDDACASLPLPTVERERLLCVAFCTAAMGDLLV